MMRPPSPIRAAPARAPRNVPVRFTSMISRQAAGDIRALGVTSGDTAALQIHTSTPPKRSSMRSATDSLNSASRTSPAHTRGSPSSDSATRSRAAPERATSPSRAPAASNAVASTRPSPRPAPVITTRRPDTSMRSAAKLARDHETLDLVGALADLEHLRVAVETGDRALEHVPGTAEDLHRLAGHLRRDAARLELGHGGLLPERLAGVTQR